MDILFSSIKVFGVVKINNFPFLLFPGKFFLIVVDIIERPIQAMARKTIIAVKISRITQVLRIKNCVPCNRSQKTPVR